MRLRCVAFNGHKVNIRYNRPAAKKLLDFMFIDQEDRIDIRKSSNLEAKFSITYDKDAGKWNLNHNGKSRFKGKNINRLGNVLMGEVIFHLISSNETGLAIHAGLVSDEKGSILMPADSGSGKSSVTTWLTTQGKNYHTDELVMIDMEDQSLQAFTRPLNIKTRGVESIGTLVDLETHADEIRTSDIVCMIPHRLANPEFKQDIPPLSRIVFPKYIADSKSEIIKLTGAEAGLEMMRSNVIARNLPNHGFSEIIKLVKDVPAYKVNYSHFDDLADLFQQI